MSDTGSKILDIGQQGGIIISGFSLIVACIIGLILFVSGLYLLFKRNSRSAQISANIINASCPYDSQRRMYDCDLTIEFTPPNRNKITTHINVGSGLFYSRGQTITVWYDSNNPMDVSTVGNYRILGIILIVIALVMVGSAYFWWWASKKSPVIGSLVTASEGLGLLSAGRIGTRFI